ncbi:transglycosylase family protein [Arthrobacter sp. ZGTC131]|uniref:transglycosylase family protein n=1 Tax=Arthrobacter sp. ZGTC131 TaxID=2058898 RepID=UPI000CE46A4E|nr:transglycosylase family protein [Arthrobacter sp. ZGTC131]
MKKSTFSTAARRGVTLAAVSAAGLALSATAANAAVPTASGSTWDALAQCESSGNWSTNTGNGFSGGLQFTPQTWAGFGGTGSPENASRAQQIAVAEKVQATQGWGAWPACAAKLGLSGGGGAAAPQIQPQSAPVQAAPVQAAPVQAAPVQVQAAPVAQAPVVAEAPTQARHAAEVAVSGQTYTVQSGDTLSKIAEKVGVHGGWQHLADANADTVTDPDLIMVGQVLQLPA